MVQVQPSQIGDTVSTAGTLVQVQARATQSWDEALQTVALNLNDRPQPGQAMLALLRTNHHLSRLDNLKDLLDAILADALITLDAQRGSILLMDDEGKDLRLAAYCCNHLQDDNSVRYSRTLANRCFGAQESLLCQDVSRDDGLSCSRSIRGGAMASVICALLRSPRQRLGVLQLDRGPKKPPFTKNDLYLADAMAASVAVGIESAQLVALQRDQFVQTVTSLARAIEMRDQYTGDHTRRVTDYSLMLAEELKLGPVEKYQIQIGAPLHDIGKIGIDDAILRKPGQLSSGEFELMKAHTTKGADIIQTIRKLTPMLSIIRHHHERWDGTGYPDRIQGEQIEIGARIVAIADAFDAMTFDRPYRPARSPDAAFEELSRQAGHHFDPAFVQAFLRLRPKIEQRLRQG